MAAETYAVLRSSFSEPTARQSIQTGGEKGAPGFSEPAEPTLNGLPREGQLHVTLNTGCPAAHVHGHRSLKQPNWWLCLMIRSNLSFQVGRGSQPSSSLPPCLCQRVSSGSGLPRQSGAMAVHSFQLQQQPSSRTAAAHTAGLHVPAASAMSRMSRWWTPRGLPRESLRPLRGIPHDMQSPPSKGNRIPTSRIQPKQHLAWRSSRQAMKGRTK